MAHLKVRLLAWAYVLLCGTALLAGTLLCLGILFSGDDRSGKTLLFVGPIFFFVSLFYLVPGFFGGLGLLRNKEWGRFLILILSFLILLLIPVGTAIGAIGIWILLSKDGRIVPPPGDARVPTPEAHASPPSISAAPTLSPRERGMFLAMAGVGAGFIVLIRAGFFFFGGAAPPRFDVLFFPALLVLAGVLVLAVRNINWPRLRRPAPRHTRPVGPATLEVLYAQRAAYSLDRTKLATCSHLQPIERAMRDAGIEVRYRAGNDVQANCLVDEARLRSRMNLAPSVSYVEAVVDQRSDRDPVSAWFRCSECTSTIVAVERHQAPPGLPVFPGEA